MGRLQPIFWQYLQNRYGNDVTKAFRGLESLQKKLNRSQNNVTYLLQILGEESYSERKGGLLVLLNRINVHYKNKFWIKNTKIFTNDENQSHKRRIKPP